MGNQQGMPKLVNYEKLRSINQGSDENPAVLQLRHEEALCKYINLDCKSTEVQIIIRKYFISQSDPDIRKTLQKIELCPHTKIKSMS